MPEAEPPHVERCQPVQRRRGEGDAVVRANRAGQPVLAKEAIEDGPHADASRGQQALAPQQIARVLIGDRQRIAVDPIAGAELAFEIGGPQIVRAPWWSAARRRGVLRAAAPALVDEPFRASRSPAVLDGRPVDARCRGASQCRSFSGPQSGCRRRADTSSCATVSVILCGQ